MRVHVTRQNMVAREIELALRLLAEQQAIFPAQQHIWAFSARGFVALAEAAGFKVTA